MEKNLSFAPANMTGSQMMSNLNYVPASTGIDGPFINKKVMDIKFVPTTMQSLLSKKSVGTTFYPATVMERNHLSYVPAGNVPQRTFNNKHPHKEFKLSWWEPNSFFNYPYMLISAFYGMKWKDNFRKEFNIPTNCIIFGDSGGFQNMTQNANLSPLQVLRWQEENCDIGLTFDEPIFLEDSNEIKRKKQINTVKNAYSAMKKRTNKNLKLYAVFQGHSTEEQKFIFDKYNEQGDISKFDGFAIGGLVPIAGNTPLVIQTLITFIDKIKKYNKPIHFFGLSGSKITPLIVYIQNKLKLSISFDSSSYKTGATLKEFIMGKTKLYFNNKKPNNLSGIPCFCPVCRNCVVEDFRSEGSISGGLLALHNLNNTIENVEKLKCLSGDEKIFREYIKNNYPEKILKLMDYIQTYFEEGIDVANQKFSNILIENKKSVTQRTLSRQWSKQ